jgi:predicted phosphohydrolase
MGGRAEVSTTVIDRCVTNAIIKTASTCEADARASIDTALGVVRGNLDVGGTINQTVSAQTTRCSQEDQLSQMLKENLDEQIKQAAGVSGFSLWGSTSSDYAQTHETINNMNADDLKKCAPQADATLKQRYQQVMGSVTYTPVVNQNVVATVSSCVQTNSAIQQHVADIKTALDSSAKTKGISISAGWLMALAALVAIGAIAFVIVKREVSKP